MTCMINYHSLAFLPVLSFSYPSHKQGYEILALMCLGHWAIIIVISSYDWVPVVLGVLLILFMISSNMLDTSVDYKNCFYFMDIETEARRIARYSPVELIIQTAIGSSSQILFPFFCPLVSLVFLPLLPWLVISQCFTWQKIMTWPCFFTKAYF